MIGRWLVGRRQTPMAPPPTPLPPSADPATQLPAIAPAAEAATPEPAPAPLAARLLAEVAMGAGVALVRHGVARALPGTSPVAGSGRARLLRGQSLAGTLVATAAMRLAARSVPGAIVVGGAALAKLLHDRRERRRSE